jgi:hypothetical protein
VDLPLTSLLNYYSFLKCLFSGCSVSTALSTSNHVQVQIHINLPLSILWKTNYLLFLDEFCFCGNILFKVKMTEHLHGQSSGNYKVIPQDDMFQTELSAAGVKLVIVDFFATW